MNAVSHDGAQPGHLLKGDHLASGVWANTAYRSKANLHLLDRRGLPPSSSAPSPAASRCGPTSAAATPPAPRSARASSMSSPPRSDAFTGHPYHRPRPGRGEDWSHGSFPSPAFH